LGAVLLIAPKGIEIRLSYYLLCNPLFLLIAPKGIEIPVAYWFFSFSYSLLIAPKGIEILIDQLNEKFPGSFNRTKRN